MEAWVRFSIDENEKKCAILFFNLEGRKKKRRKKGIVSQNPCLVHQKNTNGMMGEAMLTRGEGMTKENRRTRTRIDWKQKRGVPCFGVWPILEIMKGGVLGRGLSIAVDPSL